MSEQSFLSVLNKFDAGLKKIAQAELDRINRAHLNHRRDEDHTRAAREVEANNNW